MSGGLGDLFGWNRRWLMGSGFGVLFGWHRRWLASGRRSKRAFVSGGLLARPAIEFTSRGTAIGLTGCGPAFGFLGRGASIWFMGCGIVFGFQGRGFAIGLKG